MALSFFSRSHRISSNIIEYRRRPSSVESSADWQSAVSPIGNRPGSPSSILAPRWPVLPVLPVWHRPRTALRQPSSILNSPSSPGAWWPYASGVRPPPPPILSLLLILSLAVHFIIFLKKGWNRLESIGNDWNRLEFVLKNLWNRLVESAWPGIILSLLLILSKARPPGATSPRA